MNLKATIIVVFKSKMMDILTRTITAILLEEKKNDRSAPWPRRWPVVLMVHNGD